MLTYTDEHDTVLITIVPHGFDPWSMAPRWKWAITVEDRELARGDDFRTARGKETSWDALHALVDFLDTWWKACVEEERTEQAHADTLLFPNVLRACGCDWARYLTELRWEIDPAAARAAAVA